MRWRAARRSSPRSSATGCRATLSTSPRRPRTATAPIARWRLPSSGPTSPRPISTTSTRMAPRRRSATRSNCARSSGFSAMRARRSPCHPPNRRPGISSAPPGAIEAIFSILAIRDGIAPPTINLDNPSVETADRPRSPCREAAQDRCRLVELLRIRRNQRVGHLPSTFIVSKKRLRARRFGAEFRHIDCLSTGHAR